MRKIFFYLFFLVLFFGIKTQNLFAYNASYVLGQPDFVTATQNATQDGLGQTTGIAYDPDREYLFVSDSSHNRVLVYDLSDGITNGENAINVLGQANFTASAFGTTQNTLNSPLGLEYDTSTGYLYVADYGNGRVMVFDVNTITNGENAIYVLGEDDFTTTDASVDQDNLTSPQDVSLKNNLLYVADYLLNRILVFDISSITNGEDAIYVLGQEDFTSFTPAITQDGINSPVGVYVDNNDRLFISEAVRVLIFDVSSITNGEDAIYVLGQEDFTGQESDIDQDTMGGTYTLTLDEDNQILYVVDFLGNRILLFDVNTITNGEDAVSLLGQNDFTSSDTGTTQSLFTFPFGPHDYDESQKRFFVADYANYRVLVFEFIEIATGSSLTGGTEGSAYSTNLSTNNDQGTVEYSVVSGSLPGGLSLASNGTLSGTPTTAGTYNFTVRATDVVIDNIQEYYDEKAFSITIAAAAPGGGGGSSSSSSTGTKFICTDPEASNYKDPRTETGRPNNKYCKYPKDTLSCSVEPYLTKPIKFGAKNNIEDVKLLERFLNTYEDSFIRVNGIYEKSDYQAVISWQEKHKEDVLKPWGFNRGTGYVYVTSLRKIKEIHEAKCKETFIKNTEKKTCYIYTQNLGPGDKKGEVRALQKALKASINPNLKVDGKYGKATEEAVKIFQQNNLIKVSGIVGPITGHELGKIICEPEY